MIPRDPSSGFEEGLPDTTLYAITENLDSFYAPGKGPFTRSRENYFLRVGIFSR